MEQFKTVLNKYKEEPKNENRKKCYSFDITSTNQYYKDREEFDFLNDKMNQQFSEMDLEDNESYITPNFPRNSTLFDNEINYYNYVRASLLSFGNKAELK